MKLFPLFAFIPGSSSFVEKKPDMSITLKYGYG